MIPVALPSASFYLLLLISFLAALLLGGWLLALLVSRGARANLRRHWLISLLLMLVLVPLTAFQIVFQHGVQQIHQESERRQAALRSTLEAPTTLYGIEMPAGTRLTLQREHQPETFTSAEFPQPVLIQGIATLRLNRWLQVLHQEGVPYDESPLRTTSLKLSGEGQAAIEGWQCDISAPVEFDVSEENDIRFRTCSLSAGNSVAGIALPAGTELLASDGTLYTNGFRDNDRWQLAIPDQQVITLNGIALSGFSLRLDQQRQLHSFDNAELVCSLQLGGWRYPPGTTVSSVPLHLRKQYPNSWLLSPYEQAAERADGERAEDGITHVWDLQKTQLLAQMSNAEAGVMRFATILVGDQQEPQRPACPTGR